MTPSTRRTSPLRPVAAVACVLTTLAVAGPAPAAADALDDKQKELEALKLERDISDARADIAENEKRVRAAGRPATEVDALSGKTSLEDKVAIEVHALASAAVDDAARAVAEAVSAAGARAVVLSTEAGGRLGTALYPAAMSQLDVLQREYTRLLEVIARPAPDLAVAAVAPSLALEGVTAGVKSALDLVALFRAETSIQGVDVQLAEDALVASTARELRVRAVAAFYPKAQLPVTGSLFLERLTALAASRARADAAIAGVRAQERPPAAHRQAADQLEKANTAHDALLARLAVRDAKSGESPAEALIAAELLAGGRAQLLYLRQIKVGGNNRTRRNLFTTLFTGDGLSHSGGTIVSYMLFAADGTVQAAGTVRRYLGYRGASAIARSADAATAEARGGRP